MHITQHTDYALRVLIYLATNTDRLPTVQEIAVRFDISRTHLMKVVNGLIRHGFVEGIRGKGGGLRLASQPSEISIGDVVRKMEGEPVLVECFGAQSKCLLTQNCRLTGVFRNALNAFFASLDAVTLEELLGPAQWQTLHFAR
ncbi:Rrf2 family transcriptional regulator [Aquabacterium sp.]|uniref:RrF2 family transcriptional regulator n=1 Tax=Aquabacterium sp. TaxID=1872578 RepID=UPI0025C4D6C2|nr:Rrf2 family transcriptional regulator [Aquabacterium sp.]